MSIEQLVRLAQLGDKEALLTLIMNEKNRYYRLAYSYLGNGEDAMDALEDMIVVLYERIGQLKKQDAFYTWSKSILVNICKGMLKKQNKHILISEWEGVWHEVFTTQNTLSFSHEQRFELDEYIKRLSEEQRETIVLKYWHDFDNSTIAKILNIPLGTVKSRLYTAINNLRKIIGKEYENEKA